MAHMRTRVRERVEDMEHVGLIEVALHEAAVSSKDAKYVDEVLSSSAPKRPWSIGEAVAECFPADDSDRDIIWPWNRARDLIEPNASLPGADLIGFCTKDGETRLLIGEVKTSSEQRTPPTVMNINSGMPCQIMKNATSTKVRRKLLLTWLGARCTTEDMKLLYRAAVAKLVRSGGRDILVMGMLLRDTEPSELDISAAAEHLADNLDSPTDAEISVWYLPIPISEWVSAIDGDVS